MSFKDVLTNTFLDGQRQIGDPEADKLISNLVEREGPAEARRIFDLLIREIELPPAALPPLLQAYVSQTATILFPVENEVVAKAQALFLDHGPKLLVFLYYKSLPLLYTMAKGAIVLTQTGRLAHKGNESAIFARRIAETGQFLLYVMEQGSLTKGGKAIQVIRKIRLIHAAIRQFLLPKWNVAMNGCPINQEDMAATLMTFSISVLDALEQFGVKVDQAAQKAYLQTWNGIGQLLGIDPTLLPTTLEEARFLLETILNRQSAHSEQGVALTNALHAFARKTLPERLHDLSPALITFLIGKEKATMIQKPGNGGCLTHFLPAAITTYFKWGENLEDKVSQPLSVFLEEWSRITTRAMVGVFDQYKGDQHQVPEAFIQAWNVD